MFRPWEVESVSNTTTVNNRISDCDDDENNSACKRHHLTTDAKEIVLNVYNGLVDLDKMTAIEARKKTSLLTKVPLNTVNDIVMLGAKPRKKRNDSEKFRKVTLRDVNVIRHTVYAMYIENTIPTLDSLKQKLISEGTGIECSRTTLWEVLKKNGFKYTKIDKRQAIMETDRICKWRYNYLSDITKYREENRNIFYLDETWYDTHDIIEKGWVDDSKKCKLDTPSSRGKRIIILHCGSKEGWVHGAAYISSKNVKDSSLDYHEDMNGTNFEDWFEKTLIPRLPESSVIVLDNAPYHSRTVKTIPKSTSTKETIQKFLIENDIYFEDKYTKTELLDCIKAFEVRREYVIDTIAKRKGHDVLRLPPYYCIFNPIELIWAQLKQNVRRKNQHPRMSANVVHLIQQEIEAISAEAWSNAVQHVIKEENKYRDIFTAHPQLIISINGADETDETSDTDTD